MNNSRSNNISFDFYSAHLTTIIYIKLLVAIGISDQAGHYDIDGVSFDPDLGVVIASDGHKKFRVYENENLPIILIA